jgi:hypothetical protein
MHNIYVSGSSKYLEYIGVYNADASIWGEVSPERLIAALQSVQFLFSV